MNTCSTPAPRRFIPACRAPPLRSRLFPPRYRAYPIAIFEGRLFDELFSSSGGQRRGCLHWRADPRDEVLPSRSGVLLFSCWAPSVATFFSLQPPEHKSSAPPILACANGEARAAMRFQNWILQCIQGCVRGHLLSAAHLTCFLRPDLGADRSSSDQQEPPRIDQQKILTQAKPAIAPPTHRPLVSDTPVSSSTGVWHTQCCRIAR